MDTIFLLILLLIVIYFSMLSSLLLPGFLLHRALSRSTFSSAARSTDADAPDAPPFYVRLISFLNSLAAGVFLGVCFLGLIPYTRNKFQEMFIAMRRREVNSTELDHTHSRAMELPVAEMSILCGFFLILLLEVSVRKCSEEKHADGNFNGNEKKDGVDVERKQSPTTTATTCDGEDTPLALASPCHNHHHHHHHHHLPSLQQTDSLEQAHPANLRFLILVIALSIHSVFEGLALGLQTDQAKTVNLFIALMLHECLVSFSLGVSLTRLRLARPTYVKFSLVYSTLIPVGIAMAFGVRWLPQGPASLGISASLQGLAAGTFIHVTLLEMIPEELNQSRDKMWKLSFICLGTIFISLLEVFTEH